MTTFIYKNWCIKSHETGGYIAQKKVGNQYKETSYFNSLGSAAKYLFEQRLHYESLDIIIDATDKAQAAIAQAKLIQLINDVSEQIVGVLDA